MEKLSEVIEFAYQLRGALSAQAVLIESLLRVLPPNAVLALQQTHERGVEAMRNSLLHAPIEESVAAAFERDALAWSGVIRHLLAGPAGTT
jgi:hypothetical protein